MQGFLITGSKKEKDRTEIEVLKERNEALQQTLTMYYGRVGKLMKEIKRLEGRKK